ncbi:hypothetical protein K502DRAFT_348979 [Neoconidiobolus thromboides FSU 785]|nr:hypothetical protein K502DRAFT_348979 [Neoconidiobolus thromboides FSU 785]
MCLDINYLNSNSNSNSNKNENVINKLFRKINYTSYPYPFRGKKDIKLPNFQVTWRKGTPMTSILFQILNQRYRDSSYYYEASKGFDIISLNLDMVDIINIMSYSSSDLNELNKNIDDPIHDQTLHFDEESLEDLANYQVYQRPDDVVPIPAAPESASVYCVDVSNTSSLLANVWDTMEEKAIGNSVLQSEILNYSLPTNFQPSDISKRDTSSSDLKIQS